MENWERAIRTTDGRSRACSALSHRWPVFSVRVRSGLLARTLVAKSFWRVAVASAASCDKAVYQRCNLDFTDAALLSGCTTAGFEALVKCTCASACLDDPLTADAVLVAVQRARIAIAAPCPLGHRHLRVCMQLRQYAKIACASIPTTDLSAGAMPSCNAMLPDRLLTITSPPELLAQKAICSDTDRQAIDACKKLKDEEACRAMGASQSCAWCGEMGGIARGCYVVGVVFCEDSEYTDKVVYAKDGSCPTTDAAKLLANIQHSTRTVVLCSVRARHCLARLHQSCLSARVLRCVASHRTLHPSHNKSRYIVVSPSLGNCRDRIRNGVRVARHQDLSAAF